MSKRYFLGLALLIGSACLPTLAIAQSSGVPNTSGAPSIFGFNFGYPSPEVIAKANAGKFHPPRLTSYAARLAHQPDMTGIWGTMYPKGIGVGPVFDEVNTYFPPRPKSGEAAFGPMPGTYTKGIPFNAEYQKKYEELVKETTEGKSRDAFPACAPYGVPRMIGDSVAPYEIVQTPDIMFWYEAFARTERQIFLDGRGHKPHNAIIGSFSAGVSGPSYSGDSIGHWEGDTLVVDTVDMVPGYLDETPVPYSGELHLIERIRLIDINILEDQMTFIDPVELTKPWVVTVYLQRNSRSQGWGGGHPHIVPAPGGQQIITDYMYHDDWPCVPNVKMDANGFQVAILPQELSAQPQAADTSGSK